jgi:hypothetical protein
VGSSAYRRRHTDSMAARYGFDFELMLHDKKTLLTVFTCFVALYVAFIVIVDIVK